MGREESPYWEVTKNESKEVGKERTDDTSVNISEE